MSGDAQVHNVCNFMIDNQADSRGKPSKSGSDVPDIEEIRVRDGVAELSLTHTEADNVLASLYKVREENAHLFQGIVSSPTKFTQLIFMLLKHD